jgi:hypothetical protein
MATNPTTMIAASTMVVITNKKEKEKKKKKLIFAPRLRRGRSMTSRNCTNACNIYKERDLKKKKHHHYDDEKDQVVDGYDEKSSVSTEILFADRFALFGDSTTALFCSFLLLAIAVSINLFLEDDNNIEGISRLLTSSSFFNPSSLFSRNYTRLDDNSNNNNRCAKTPDADPVLSKSGDINQLFERIVALGTNHTHRNETIFTKNHSVTVHSRPDGTRIGSQNRRSGVVSSSSSSPWMVTLENFITEDECDAMIEDGRKEGFSPSVDAKEQNHRRTATPNTTTTTMKTVGRRNSETAWCTSKNNCTYREVPDRLHRRLSEILGIPSENSEGFQILKYDVGQCKCLFVLIINVDCTKFTLMIVGADER